MWSDDTLILVRNDMLSKNCLTYNNTASINVLCGSIGKCASVLAAKQCVFKKNTHTFCPATNGLRKNISVSAEGRKRNTRTHLRQTEENKTI